MRAIAFGKVDSGTLGSRLSEASAFVTERAALNAILVIIEVLFRYFTARMLENASLWPSSALFREESLC